MRNFGRTAKTGYKRYEELAKARTKDNAQLVISRDNKDATFKLTELLEFVETNPHNGRRIVRREFARGGIYIHTTEGLTALRDALNVVLDKEVSAPLTNEGFAMIDYSKTVNDMGTADEEVPEHTEDAEAIRSDKRIDKYKTYETMSRIKLIEECRKRNLSVTTKLKKDEYINILLEDDAIVEETTTEAADDEENWDAI